MWFLFHFFYENIENFRHNYMCKQWQRTRSQTDLCSLHKILIFLSFFRFDAVLRSHIPHVWITCMQNINITSVVCYLLSLLYLTEIKREVATISLWCVCIRKWFIYTTTICNISRKIWKTASGKWAQKVHTKTKMDWNLILYAINPFQYDKVMSTVC